MSKKDRSRYENESVFKYYRELRFQLENRFYNLYRSNWKWTGLTRDEEKFIMDSLWKYGQVAAFQIENTDLIGFAKFTATSRNMYGCAATVRLMNEWGSPVIPQTDLIVDKNVALGYLSSSQKGLYSIVSWFIDRIAQAEMVIRNQLALIKMPFLIPVDKASKEKMEDIIERLLNNELVIYAEDVDVSLFKAIQTEVPYLIDKIQLYEDSLINELKLVLGVANNGINKVEQVQMAQITSGIAETSGYEIDYVNNLEQFIDSIHELFGHDEINVERNVENTIQSQAHDITEKTGPKEDVVEEDE